MTACGFNLHCCATDSSDTYQEIPGEIDIGDSV
jgi:hypothetical protein